MDQSRGRRAAAVASRPRARGRSCRRGRSGWRCASARSIAGSPLGPRDAVQPREHGQDLPAGELDIEIVELRDDPHRHPRRLRLLRAAGSRAPRSNPRSRSPGRSASASSSTCRRRWDRAARGRCRCGTVRSRWSTAVSSPKRLTTERSSIAAVGGGCTMPIEDTRGGALSSTAAARTASVAVLGRVLVVRRAVPVRRCRRVRRCRPAWELEQLGQLGGDHDVAGQLDPALEVGLHRVEIAARQLAGTRPRPSSPSASDRRSRP